MLYDHYSILPLVLQTLRNAGNLIIRFLNQHRLQQIQGQQIQGQQNQGQQNQGQVLRRSTRRRKQVNRLDL